MEIYNLIANSKYFDALWYLKNNEDVAKLGLDPIKHYISYGWQEGRNPSAEFNNNAYLQKYEEARTLKVAPLLHYEAKGKYERRSLTNVLNKIVKEKTDTTKANKVIYTCISGDYIDLFEHRYQDLSWDYIAFTDNKELLDKKTFGHWQILPLPLSNLEDTKNARYVKIAAHEHLKNYTYSVWVDGNIDILTHVLFDRFEELIKNDTLIAISQHNERDCIYDEAIVCKNHVKDNAETIDRHMQVLIDAHYPRHNGLFNTATIFRKHNEEKCIQLMDMWWYMVKNYSRRDQLSLCYCAWKQGITIEKYFSTPTLEMYYDYIQIMQGFVHVTVDSKTGKQSIRRSENK